MVQPHLKHTKKDIISFKYKRIKPIELIKSKYNSGPVKYINENTIIKEKNFIDFFK